MFSQNKRRCFNDNILFREMFNEIIIQCINQGIVRSETIVAEGLFLPANVYSQKFKVVHSITVKKGN